MPWLELDKEESIVVKGAPRRKAKRLPALAPRLRSGATPSKRRSSGVQGARLPPGSRLQKGLLFYFPASSSPSYSLSSSSSEDNSVLIRFFLSEKC